MKRIISLALVLMLVLSLSVTAFAAGETGTIEITNPSAFTTYEVYKLLDLESYTITPEAYSYKVNANWAGFFATAEALAHVSIDANGYVTWITDENDSTVAAFAQKALAYAEANGISPVKSSSNPGDFTISGTIGIFSDLELGWYLVDSSAGALCALTTTNPTAVVNAKNQPPIIDKQVKEDQSGNWGESNNAAIGEIINYRTTITVTPGAQNYVLHDKMDNSLTFIQDLTDPANPRGVTEIHLNGATVDASNYTVVFPVPAPVKPEDCAYGCTFHVEFKDDYIKTLAANDTLTVFYNAELNENAVIYNSSNKNESFLEYGEEHFTAHDTTDTYSYFIDLVKTDTGNQLITGAKFKIYDAETGGNEIPVVKIADHHYRLAKSDETGVEIEVTSTTQVKIDGFDAGTYYLEETDAPEGYNKLTARHKFVITNNNLESSFPGGIYSVGTGVQVVNKTGNMLPETGAMGTTLFLTFGMFTVLAAGVLLVTKKRMAMIEE